MSRSDGGPAFPRHVYAGPNESGMTLRDWFAGQALMGLFSDVNANLSYGEVARACYRQADAMLAERGK